MIFITGSKKILLDFYFKNNIFSNKNNLSSLYYIKPYIIKKLSKTIINYYGIHILYYSSHAPTDKFISYKEHNEHSFYK